MSFFSRVKAAYGALVSKGTIDEWFREFGGTYPSASGLSINQVSAIGVSTVYACVSIRAKDLARCAPRLLLKEGARSQTPVTNHPVAALFDAPNPLQTWFEWAVQMHSAYLLKGNAYAAVIRDGRGNPVSLWALNPDTVTLYEGHDGQVFYNCSRSGPFLTHQLRSLPLMIPEEDIFHLRGLSFNSLFGLTTISVARDAIGVAMGLEQQASRFMSNGARPSGVLETEQKLDKSTSDRVREQWESMRAGIHNAGKTAILEAGLKWNQMQLSGVDLEFIAQRRFSIEEIARFFGVPLHKLGVTGEVGKLRLDQADQSYVNTTIMPDLDMWEQKFDQRFELGKADLRADFDERQLLRAEESTRINNYRLAVMSGLKTQNECRALEGDPPVDGADVLLTPVNLAAVGSDQSGTAPDGAGRPDDGDPPDPGAANEEKPKPKPKPKAGDPALNRVALYVVDQQSGSVRDALAGKREGEALDPIEDEPK